MLTNRGKDYVARALGGSDTGRTGTGAGVTYAATTMTDTGAAFTASSGGPPEDGGLVGNIIVSGSVWGCIVKNTTTVATVDLWHNATAPNTTGTTPSANALYIIVPGNGPAWYIGLSTATLAVSAAHKFLTQDAATVSEIFNTSGNLNRKAATFAHTTGTSTYTVQFAATANANDGTNAINRIGVFAHGVTVAPTTTTSGIMLFETDVSSPPTLINGDSITVTDTVTLS